MTTRTGNSIRTYFELVRLPTFEERYSYLKLGGKIGAETFGYDRWFNQKFYSSREWRKVRDLVIVRDNGCDLAVSDMDIGSRIIIHHMNPITLDDINTNSEFLLDPNFLICASYNTHVAIHYGSDEVKHSRPIERQPNDTCPWKHI